MNLFLLTTGAAVIWAVRAYVWPYKPCPVCKGRKTNRGSTKRRFGSCRWCKGSGMRRVLGAKQVHRAVRSLIAYRRNDK
jgi:DnaJ-class molecular chaperone